MSEERKKKASDLTVDMRRKADELAEQERRLQAVTVARDRAAEAFLESVARLQRFAAGVGPDWEKVSAAADSHPVIGR
jgi:hypothetical protein